jgi:RNA polymerase sigma factor (sigma-70 family)
MGNWPLFDGLPGTQFGEERRLVRECRVNDGPCELGLAGRDAESIAREAGGDRSITLLLSVLRCDYEMLLDRLAVRLGSREAAIEALHDVYLKLRNDIAIGNVNSPRAYLYRMALNLTANARRKVDRMMIVDPSSLTSFADAAPDPEKVAIASDEFAHAMQALHELPYRCREIFLAKWRDEKPQAAIAAEFGLHKRSVQKELARAEGHIRRKLRRESRSHRDT